MATEAEFTKAAMEHDDPYLVCAHADAMRRIAELEAALRPFAVFGKNVDDNGWTSTIHREPISMWFGPSDFRAARVLMPQAKD